MRVFLEGSLGVVMDRWRQLKSLSTSYMREGESGVWNPELEFRFGSYFVSDRQRNVAGITEKQYLAILNILNSVSPWEDIFQVDEVVTVDTPYNPVLPQLNNEDGTKMKTNYRQTMTYSGIYPGTSNTAETSRTSKTAIYQKNSTDYPIRISLSREATLTGFPANIEAAMTSSKTTRAKTRRRVTIDQQNIYVDINNGVIQLSPGGLVTFNLDLTKVNMGSSTDPVNTQYEFEVEILTDLTELNPNQLQAAVANLADNLYQIMRMVYATDIPYTVNEWAGLSRQYNLMTGVNSATMTNQSLFQARNLHVRDMVEGGLFTDGSTGKTGYTLTYKADGHRKLLVGNKLGIWMIYPPSEANLLVKWPSGTTPVNFCIEAELLSPEQRFGNYQPDQEYYLLMEYDLLYYRTDNPVEPMDSPTNVANYPLNVRLAAINRVNEIISSMKEGLIQTNQITRPARSGLPDIILEVKQFYPFETVDQLNQLVAEMESRVLTDQGLSYHTDGYIVTPVETPYLSKYRNPKNPD